MSVPTFKAIFGNDWDKLPNVMKKHYSNRAYSDDLSIAEGVMKVEASFFWKLLNPISKIFGILVPYTGDNIPVTVTFRSDPQNGNFIFDRVFNFPNKKPYQFFSTLHPVGGSDVIEVMKMGIGWKCEFIWRNGKVLLLHKGYALKIFGKFMPLPISLLFGKGYAEETPIDDDNFYMNMEVTHPWWGKMLGYSGTFKMSLVKNEDVK